MNKEEIYLKLATDLPFYAKEQLRIKDKNGKIVPLVLNKPQRYVHDMLEKQLKETGRVRAVILKGRQQGMSTYTAARFYHHTVMNKGTNTFIFAHDSSGSQSLYNMVKMYYEESVDKKFRPQLGATNRRELIFKKMNSGYLVGTAGTRGLGRSKTNKLIHWSEVAYSPHSEEHSAGLMQTVPDAPGTEIILESTANGQGNYFHMAVTLAREGKSDFILIFVPWFWSEEYQRPIDDKFELEQPSKGQNYKSEQEYYEEFKDQGLTKEHLHWRRMKILNDFKGDVSRFLREYPFTVDEAFEASGDDPYISPKLVRASRVTPYVQCKSPIILGVDPAREGGDRFVVATRRGRNMLNIEKYPVDELIPNTKRLARYIDEMNPLEVNIDAGGMGVGVFDALNAMGYSCHRKVDFGQTSTEPDRYKNFTAEMFAKAREWLEDKPNSLEALNEKTFQDLMMELCSRGFEYYRNSILEIESKKQYKTRLKRSPDIADAFLLTFAGHVAKGAVTNTVSFMQSFTADTSWSAI